MKSILDSDELRDTPKLRALSGTNPYLVPEYYFETLAGEIENKLDSGVKQIRGKPLRSKQIFIHYAAAASIVLFLMATSWIYFYEVNRHLSVQTQVITVDDLTESIYFYDLDLNSLAEEASVTNSAVNTDYEEYLLKNDWPLF
ncbi:MAG: hypothetical protein LC117_03060 [Bacteroidia bacterium]|nr:hypothetical protein [Bacteroidia bacterium]MCZ2276893.1 hypothetical protein [Bacteroidia bacterium]